MRNFTRYQWQVLTILTLVNFVNYIDRQIIYALVPLIQAEFVLSFSQVGLLGTVFSLMHSVCTLPLGVLADRTSRKKVISYGVLAWSVATFLTGLAGSFRTLLQVRGLVALGEAAYAPAATAIITGSFPRALRARVQGVFDTGMFIGGAVGLALGSLLAERVGWRPAFFIVGVPGLILALSVLRLPEPAESHPRREAAVPVRQFLRLPGYLMVLGAGWFITFAGWAYIFWGTTVVHRYKGFSLEEAGLILGLCLTLAGLLGVSAGAALADRLARRLVYGRVLVIGLGFLTSAPLIFAAFHAESRALFVALFFLGCFFMTWYHGPLTATIHDLTPPAAHASATGFYYFFVNLTATPWASLMIGWVADRTDLLAALQVALGMQVIGALGFLSVAWLLHRRGLPAAAAPGQLFATAEPAPVTSQTA